MLEKRVETRLIEAVKKAGGKAYKLECPGTVGVPDRLIILPGGRIYFVETKRPKKGVLSARQKQRQKEMIQLGADVRNIKNYDEVEAFIKEVQIYEIHRP